MGHGVPLSRGLRCVHAFAVVAVACMWSAVEPRARLQWGVAVGAPRYPESHNFMHSILEPTRPSRRQRWSGVARAPRLPLVVLLALSTFTPGALAQRQPEVARGAPASEAPSAAPVAPEHLPAAPELVECGEGRFQLKGADAGGTESNFPPEWNEPLARILACAQRPELEDTCIVVQGRFDALPFREGAAPVNAASGVAGAQSDRADRRARLVMSHLLGMGARPGRLQSVPAPIEPTFRGVEITLSPGCAKPADYEPAPEPLPEPAPEAAAEPAAVSTALTETEPEARPQPEAEPAPEPHVERPVWVEGEALFSATLTDPEDLFGSALRVGGGFQHGGAYARVGFGLAVTSNDTARGAWEVLFALGGVFDDWLQLGAVVVYGEGSDAMFAGWIERGWSAGIESRQCVAELARSWHLCLREALLPLGEHEVRGELRDGRVYLHAPNQETSLRVDVGVLLGRSF